MVNPAEFIFEVDGTDMRGMCITDGNCERVWKGFIESKMLGAIFILGTLVLLGKQLLILGNINWNINWLLGLYIFAGAFALIGMAVQLHPCRVSVAFYDKCLFVEASNIRSSNFKDKCIKYFFPMENVSAIVFTKRLNMLSIVGKGIRAVDSGDLEADKDTLCYIDLATFSGIVEFTKLKNIAKSCTHDIEIIER